MRMSTFERHRQYLLRRQRSRRLRRRAVTAAAVLAGVLVTWSMASRLGPSGVAPPPPAEVGRAMARTAARTAARSVNRVHEQLRPGYRDEAKRAVMRLLAGRDSGGGTSDTMANVCRVVFSAGMVDEDSLTGAAPATSPGTLDILLIGLDSRLGDERGRADALHLLTIDVSAPHIRITSIPRGTHSPLGYENEASNIISNVRAARGREELQRRVARMCRRDSVPYYVEIGFSDAFGILELLGYEDPGAELQALRQRKDFQFGDHNRCYNQGLFVRSAILRLLPLLEGATGELLLRAGLDLVHSNLTAEQCRGLVYILNDAGMADSPSLVDVTLRSRFRGRIERAMPAGTVDPAAPHAVAGLRYDGMGGDARRAERRIRSVLAEAAGNRGRPERVRALLSTLFTQHAWLQLPTGALRRQLRDSLAAGLLDACVRMGDAAAVQRIRRTLRADERLFPPAPGERAGASVPTVSMR